MRRSTASVLVKVVRPDRCFDRPDRLAGEEPMEIRVQGAGQEPEQVAVTMRTPGRDFDLAVGFLFGEGLVSSRDEVTSVRYCDLVDQEQRYNVVTVHLGVPFSAPGRRRSFAVSAACGVCGKASLDELETGCRPVAGGPVLATDVVTSLPGALRGAQRVFSQTGGLHAAGLFDAAGALRSSAEDVGRHNAVDKLVGGALLAGEVPLSSSVLMVSGRVSFEIVQKAAMAGVPVLCAVSAPTSLAVDAAQRLGVTVVGFLRDQGFNIYSRPERIGLHVPA
ncbi:MAG: formate dehydrogenase accessory sulfurtransferase FdhD [Acidimicrobiales bacterium]